MAGIDFLHGGNIYEIEQKYNKKVIDFSANINPLGLPARVKKTICENFDRILHYPDPEAKGIRAAISGYLKIKKENVLVGNGSTELIYLIASYFKPRTSLIPLPTFSEYERAARTVKSKIKFFKFNEKKGFGFDISHIAASDMLFLCNPNNPTGNLIFKISGLSCRFPAKITVIDETFMDFLPRQEEHTFISQAVKNKKIIVLRTLTKFFALPGLRLGYLVAHKEIINKLKAGRPPWSVNALAQLAGEMLLSDKNYIKKTHRLIEKERGFLSRQIAKIKGLKTYPSTTNFILIKLENKKLSSALLVKELIKSGLLVRDCANFRGLDDRFIRIAVRTRKENLKLVRVLNSAVRYGTPSPRRGEGRGEGGGFDEEGGENDEKNKS